MFFSDMNSEWFPDWYKQRQPIKPWNVINHCCHEYIQWALKGSIMKRDVMVNHCIGQLKYALFNPISLLQWESFLHPLLFYLFKDMAFTPNYSNPRKIGLKLCFRQGFIKRSQIFEEDSNCTIVIIFVTKLLSIITHSPGPLYLSPSPEPELLLMESLSTSIFATGAGISE